MVDNFFSHVNFSVKEGKKNHQKVAHKKKLPEPSSEIKANINIALGESSEKK